MGAEGRHTTLPLACVIFFFPLRHLSQAIADAFLCVTASAVEVSPFVLATQPQPPTAYLLGTQEEEGKVWS